ncbi:DUF2946 domain-containing protein [Pseudomonas sp. 21LCFQ010]|uniref:DUF2946 domain-containing protein n=1 Tax=Pseudomonas sp. 21LCFQ010 TaxID=2957506 RepID=UPI0020979640|nr:DUF2946 domain-containing protein [Pseudomonas sp. 21LCFQ010]MCO8166036.1 DUF2946 domain-containing protein [Pseudomonas sp. 21LCFQ010]
MKPDSRISTGRSPGHWLACFAMFMVLLGPLIGQASAWMQHAQPMPHAMPMSMPMAEHPCMGMEQGKHHHQSVSLEHLLDACGYCSLLFNSPGIVQTFTDVLRQPIVGAIFSPFSIRLAARDTPVFPGARSHAPPVGSLYRKSV